MREKARKFLNKINFDSRKSIALGMVLFMALAGMAYAQFYRTTGSTGFDYGYGYGSEDGYGYGYGYHQSESQANYGFFGSDGKATGVSATSTRTSFTVTYTTNYLAKNRINYGTTNSFGSNSTQTGFQTGANTTEVTGLTCGTTYHYRVETTDAGNNVWYSTATSHTIRTSSCSSGGGGGTTAPPADEDTTDPTPKTIAQSAQSILSSIGKILEAIQAGLANGTISESEARTMISNLTSIVKALIALLTTVEAPDACEGVTLNRNLTIGSVGNDVRCLQATLNARGFLVASAGAGSPGNETTYFGQLTRAALARFQAANNIAPAVGYFGPITRAFLGI